MRRKNLIIAGCLELLAVAFANWHQYLGLQTDEAKYLLNIPYPHPPLIRTVMSMTEFIPFQELFWRLAFATILVQLVWLVWDMGKDLGHREQVILCGAYFSCTAFLLYAGTVMLSPVFVMFAIAFLWLRSRKEIAQKHWGLIGLLWLCCVFSVFQGVLLAPLAWNVLRRGAGSTRATWMTLVPLALLGLHVLGSPLTIATLMIHGDQGITGSVFERLSGSLTLLAVGGGGIGTIAGILGLLKKRSPDLLTTAFLVLAYTTLSVPFPFYAILWTPLLLAGIHDLLRTREFKEHIPLLPAFALSGAILAFVMRPVTPHTEATDTMNMVIPQMAHCTRAESCSVMISGNFGHQWQHASPYPVLRYVPARAADAAAVVCLSACEPMFNTAGWKRLENTPVEAWVRK